MLYINRGDRRSAGLEELVPANYILTLKYGDFENGKEKGVFDCGQQGEGLRQEQEILAIECDRFKLNQFET